ncbi:hypothetical protein MNBD_GAMMA16-2200 [hydrothermal vent metagenome]|uniref:HTH luxR-type domain-containing protein n=1 Tax=hydrothermal vent metagenome TaxID=652676 RepID=A0A3B1A2L2_9ZZZZ
MYFSGLSTTTKYNVISIIDSCLSVNTEDEFKCKVLGKTEDLFGQGMTACGLADLKFSKVSSLSNLGFPSLFLEKIIDSTGTIKSPLFYRWVNSHSPQNIDEEQKRNDSLSSKQLSPYLEFELGNVLSHGLVDFNQNYGSYFAFAQIAERVETHHAEIIEILIPHLHVAYSRLMREQQPPLSTPITCARKPALVSTNPDEIALDSKEKMLTNSITLTVREKDVMRWLFDGKSNWEIGKILNISEYTVKNYVQRLINKFGAKNRTHVVAKALNMGLIELGN